MVSYAPSDLLEGCPELPSESSARPTVSGTVVTTNSTHLIARDRQPPADKLQVTLETNPSFHATWLRNRTDLSDTSQSGWDMALASILLRTGGWSDQEIVDACIAHRVAGGGAPKRPGYYGTTLNKARASLPSVSEEHDPHRGLLSVNGATQSDPVLEVVDRDANGRSHILVRLGGNVVHSDTFKIESSRSRTAFLKALAAKAPSLRREQLDALEKNLVDFVAAEAERRALPDPEPEREADPDEQADAGLRFPTIIINRRQLRHVVRDAWNAVFKKRGDALPRLFSRQRTVIAVIGMPEDPTIRLVSTDHMHARLARVATWKKHSDDEVVDCYPPPRVATDMLELPDSRLQPLDAILSMPFFSESGDLITEAGYYPKEAILLHNPLSIGKVPDRPDAGDVDSARDTLDEIFHDFRFVAASDYTHAVGMLVTPMVRRLIRRVSPLHSIEAPTPGSGKGLLVSAVVETITGKPVLTNPFPTDAEETRKAVAAILSSGPTFILLDNAKQGHTVDSPTLAAVLTTDNWSDRLLGTPRSVTYPNTALWMMTANNPSFSMEMVRRTVRVRIDPRRERPWERKGFRHPQLLSWIAENRGTLVHAVAVLVRHWITQDRPKPSERLGSFETWSDVVGGILTAAGYAGFLQGQDELYAASDREGAEWGDFVEVWWKRYEEKPQTVAALKQTCTTDRVLVRVLGAGTELSQLTKLGTALLAQRDRCYRGYRIELARDAGHKGKLYSLVRTGAPQSDRGASSDAGSPVVSPLPAHACDESGSPGSLRTLPEQEEWDSHHITGGVPECDVPEDSLALGGPQAPQVPRECGSENGTRDCNGEPRLPEAPLAPVLTVEAPPGFAGVTAPRIGTASQLEAAERAERGFEAALRSGSCDRDLRSARLLLEGHIGVERAASVEADIRRELEGAAS